MSLSTAEINPFLNFQVMKIVKHRELVFLFQKEIK